MYKRQESALAEEIDKFKPINLDIAYLASKGIIKMRYDRNSVSPEVLNDFKNNIRNTLNAFILSIENIPASKVLLDLLHENKLTISLVESVTGGNLASALVNHPGASKALVASNILYTSESKKEFLSSDISNDWSTLTENLAKASKIKYNSNISIAILGEAGPVPSSDYKIGQIFISIATDTNTETIEHNLRGSRDDIINRSVNNAIWDLIKFIKKL